MLSLADGLGWAPIIVVRVFVAPFTQVLDLLLCICSHIQRVWLIYNRAVLLGETKLFQHEHVCQNHRMFVKQNVLDDNACM